MAFTVLSFCPNGNFIHFCNKKWFLFIDENFPTDLFGYWSLTDDLMFFGNQRNFTVLSSFSEQSSQYMFLTK